MPQTYRTPVVRHDVDHDGAAVTFLQILDGREVKMLRETYDWLVESGYTLRWTHIKGGYGCDYPIIPCARATGSLVVAARVIVNAGAGQQVNYADRNRFNLRRENLIIREGYAKRRDAAFAPSAGRPAPTLAQMMA